MLAILATPFTLPVVRLRTMSVSLLPARMPTYTAAVTFDVMLTVTSAFSIATRSTTNCVPSAPLR